MPSRRGNVRPLCQHSNPSAHDRRGDSIRHRQHPGVGVSAFEQTVADLRRSGKFFSPKDAVYISRAPGRLDLMGGNVDYTGGLVFQATIREATWSAVQRRSDGRIEFWNPQMQRDGWLDHVAFELSCLTSEEAVRRAVNANPKSRWTAYVL